LTGKTVKSDGTAHLLTALGQSQSNCNMSNANVKHHYTFDKLVAVFKDI